MAIEVVPEWMAQLDDEDVSFIKKFILASGSLKEVAGVYGVTYPTVRLRLDRLIQKIEIGEREGEEPYRKVVVSLKNEYKEEKKPGRRGNYSRGGYSRGYGGKGYKRDSYREDRKERFEKNEDAVQADQERSENE